MLDDELEDIIHGIQRQSAIDSVTTPMFGGRQRTARLHDVQAPNAVHPVALLPDSQVLNAVHPVALLPDIQIPNAVHSVALLQTVSRGWIKI